jgi:hypothetical protein
MNPEEIKRVVREVKILDAVLKETTPTEEDNRVHQFVWVQIQDVESKNIYEVSLSLANACWGESLREDHLCE